jgi:hypothetical protein
MSFFSFWKNESKETGKPAADLIQEYYDERDMEEKKEEERLKSDFKTLFSYVREYYEVDPEESDYEPIEMLSVDFVSVSYSMNKDKTSFIAWVKCADDKDRLIKFTQINYYGSYMDPPDSDSYCEVLGERSSKQ